MPFHLPQLPWKSLTSIIEYYYMWKTTDRYVQQVNTFIMPGISVGFFSIKSLYSPIFTSLIHLQLIFFLHIYTTLKFSLFFDNELYSTQDYPQISFLFFKLCHAISQYSVNSYKLAYNKIINLFFLQKSNQKSWMSPPCLSAPETVKSSRGRKQVETGLHP